MKILLLGATGFIGKNLKEAWTGRYDLYAPSHRELDLLDAEAVERYLKEGYFDIVLHTANTNHLTHPEQGPHILEHNLRMFYNLERCRNLYGKLYYFGSGAEYDMRHYIPRMPESYFGIHIPQDPYGFSKYIMSKQATGNIYDLRLFGVFGKYEEWQRRFISNMICQHLEGGPLQMRQNAGFDYLYIDDLIVIMEWFLNHTPKHRHYNVCSGRRVELLRLAQIVNEVAGRQYEIRVERPGLAREYTGDNKRLADEMGELPLTDMHQAVEWLYQFYRRGFEEEDLYKWES